MFLGTYGPLASEGMTPASPTLARTPAATIPVEPVRIRCDHAEALPDRGAVGGPESVRDHAGAPTVSESG